MIVRQRADLARAQRAVQRAADELAAVRRAIEGDEPEGARRALEDALATGATAEALAAAELDTVLDASESAKFAPYFEAVWGPEQSTQ